MSSLSQAVICHPQPLITIREIMHFCMGSDALCFCSYFIAITTMSAAFSMPPTNLNLSYEFLHHVPSRSPVVHAISTPLADFSDVLFLQPCPVIFLTETVRVEDQRE